MRAELNASSEETAQRSTGSKFHWLHPSKLRNRNLNVIQGGLVEPGREESMSLVWTERMSISER